MNTKFKYSVLEKMVGIFMLSILILLLSTVILLGRGKDWFQKYNTYYTSFNESYNLQPGAAVKYLETDIGKVKDVKLVENRVEIRLAILQDYASRIRADVIAKVESPTFIGSEYIAVIPGSLDAQLVPPGGELKSAARKNIVDYLDEFEVEKTARALTDAVQSFTVFVEHIQDPEGPFLSAIDSFKRTSLHVETVARRIDAGEGTVGRLLTSTELLDAAMGQFNKVETILDHVAEASAKTPETMDMLQDNLVQIDKLRAGIEDNMARIRELLETMQANMPRVETILENTAEGSRNIPEMSLSALQGIKDARAELEKVDEIIQALQKNFLIRSNLPPQPVGINTDAQLRE